jgi:hypothetical protein
MATSESSAVAVIAYDVQYPEPLHSARPIRAPFASAFALSTEETLTAFASLDITLRSGSGAETKAEHPEFETLRSGTPAARCLPLLEAIARNREAEIVLSYVSEMELVLELRPLAKRAVPDRQRAVIIELSDD